MAPRELGFEPFLREVARAYHQLIGYDGQALEDVVPSLAAVTRLLGVLLATTIGCAPKAKPHVESSRARVGSTVVFRALEPDAKSNGPRLQAPCPVDLSREVTCPAPSAVVEVVFSNDGRVARSRVSRSSGIQALDLGCMLAANSCVAGQSSQQASLECSVQCE